VGAVSYTARARVVVGHSANETYYLEVDFQDAVPRRSQEKSVLRASNGRSETLYHRADTVWKFTLAPANGDQLSRILEFVASTAYGDTFLAWPYGTEAVPLSLRRKDDGYTIERFKELVSDVSDYFTVSFDALEVTA
jgi:hypothetical protein